MRPDGPNPSKKFKGHINTNNSGCFRRLAAIITELSPSAAKFIIEGMGMLKNLRITTIGWIFILVLVSVGIAFVAIETITIKNISKIETTWDRFEEGRSEKARALNALRREIGYGGMIHRFKNYVLSQDREHADVVHIKLGGAHSALARYRALGLNDTEKAALQDVENMLAAYAEALIQARALVDEGALPEEIDSKVRVDDGPAFRGLEVLDGAAGTTATGATMGLSKSKALAQLRKTLGYGGLIHHFKNFVLRHDHALLEITRQDIANAWKAINGYNEGNLNDREKKAVLDIAAVIDAYAIAIEKTELLEEEGRSTVDIDRAVRVDDGPALGGFDTLTREIANENDNEAKQLKETLALVYSLVETATWMAGIVSAALVFLSLWLFRYKIVAPISNMTEVMTSLAAGNLKQDIPDVDQDNEIGDMARAVRIFKANAIEQRHGEEIIRNSEARIRAVFDNVIDGIVTIDEKGTVETFNPAAERLFGFAAEEVVGKNVKMLMPEPYHGEHDDYLGNYMRTGEAKVIGIGREVTGRRKDGSTFPMELAVSEMQIDGTRMFAGIVRDISERKAVEKSKAEFISTVSHELRTPLTSIKGSLGLVISGAAGDMPDKMAPMIKIAHSNCDRLVRLINDILDIEKIAAGKMEFSIQEVNLHEIVTQAIESNKGYGEDRGISFDLISTMPDARVDGDADRLMQVMANLLSNAAKYSPEKDTVEISLARHGKGYRVSVTDKGQGIPEEFHGRIFQKFSQADSSDTRQKGGTGLGLNITREIIEYHGGKIDFVTEQGKGSTFFFDLPGREEKRVAQQEQPKANESRPRILVCEDEPDISRLIVMMLAEEGYDTDTAFSADEALLKLNDNEYDAMTLDICLPGKDGISLFKDLRAHPHTRDLPIIVISALPEQKIEEMEHASLGVVDWMEKPIDQDRLADGLRRAVGGMSEGSRRILHVEDDLDVIHIVAAVVGDMATVESVMTMAEAKRMIEEKRFDLVILDLMLPDGNGEDLLPLLENGDRPPTPVIVFSAKEDERDFANYINTFLVKSRTSNETLHETIRSAITKQRGKATKEI